MTTYGRYLRAVAEGAPAERLVFFSDAVFAIAMTLLVVELRVPELEGDELGVALTRLTPQYLTFILSFAVIGVVWMSHHRKFRAITHCTQTLLRINLFLLLAVASMPFSTAVLGRYGSERLSVYIYATTICLSGFTLSAMWIYAWHHGLVDGAVTVDVFRYVLVQSFPVPGIFLLSIPVAMLFGATAAEITWAAALPAAAIITRVYRALPSRTLDEGRQ
ncbi:TMEM175 family protein [Glutamicibacter protophormiae]|uniref:TMEM175 family protein n=1 Tax=Glutamicibacter protophormiae TaxID=37930 RepID=UPI003A8DF341